MSSQTSVQTSTPAKIKRLNINLPAPVYDELERLASSSSRSMTEIVRTALGLVKVAIEAESQKNKLAIVKPDGKLLKEIVLLR